MEITKVIKDYCKSNNLSIDIFFFEKRIAGYFLQVDKPFFKDLKGDLQDHTWFKEESIDKNNICLDWRSSY